MCSCRRTRAPHLLLEPSAGRFSVRLYRFSLQRAGESHADSNLCLFSVAKLSLLFVPCSLFLVLCSLFLVPCSLFPALCSLLPVPCSLTLTNKLLTIAYHYAVIIIAHRPAENIIKLPKAIGTLNFYQASLIVKHILILAVYVSHARLSQI